MSDSAPRATDLRPRLVSAGVIFLMLVAMPAAGDSDDPRPIRVTVGQPSLWTLEQAHYLLTRMHERSNALRSAPLTETTLDPNKTHGSRVEILKTFLGVSAGLDEPVGHKNRLELERYQRQVDNAAALRQQLVDKRARQLELVRAIGALKVEAAALPANDRGREVKTAQAAALEAEKALVDAEISALETQIAAASSVAVPALASPPVTAPSAPASFMLDSLLQGTPTGLGNPQIHASTALDNHIQLQYELIAKQLTLLRDEVGPDLRIVFLELPASFDPRPGKAEKRVVRVEWEVEKLCLVSEEMRDAAEWIRDTAHALSVWQDVRSDARVSAAQAQQLPMRPADLGDICQLPRARIDRVVVEWRRYARSEAMRKTAERKAEEQRRASWEEHTEELAMLAMSRSGDDEWARTEAAGRVYREQGDLWNQKAEERAAEALEQRRLHLRASFDRVVCELGRCGLGPELVAGARSWGEFVRGLTEGDESATAATLWAPLPEEGGGAAAARVTDALDFVRVVDVIPRKNALNVNQIHKTQSGFGLAAKITKIFGFGAAASYSRQKEVFDQFITQGVFASGHGKGRRTFGWTFGPMPGSKEVAPGQRTTYAAVLVPRRAIAIELVARGWDHKRKRDGVDEWGKACPQGLTTCEPGVARERYVLPILADDQGFYLTDVEYTPVRPGERTTVQLRGTYFSPQIGVLIDGVPLRKSSAIARLDLQDAPRPASALAAAATFEVEGEFERVNATTLTLSFRVGGASGSGTPVISLVTPQKAYAINLFRLDVRAGHHHVTGTSLSAMSEKVPMFAAPLAVDRVLAVREKPGFLEIDLAGAGFAPDIEVVIGGAKTTLYDSRSDRLTVRTLALGLIEAPRWEVSVAQRTFEGIRTVDEHLSNPAAPRLLDYEIIHAEDVAKSDKRSYQVLFQVARYPQKVSVGELDQPDIAICTAPGMPPATGTPRCRALSPNELLVSFESAAAAPILELRRRQPLTGETVSTLAPIVPPLPPSIDGVVNAETGKPSGLLTGGYPIVVNGSNLEDVVKVSFGPHPAPILDTAPEAILVVAPAAVPAGPQLVRLETDVRYLGRQLTNAGDFQNGSLSHLRFEFEKPEKDE